MSCKHKKDSIDLTSTDGDSEEEVYVHKTNPLKHKTELCKTFSELGFCNYKEKCRFAHGFEELVRLPVKQHFRKKKCNGFWKNGCCQYGIRCQFGHSELDWQSIAGLTGLQTVCTSAQPHQSKLLKLLWA